MYRIIHNLLNIKIKIIHDSLSIFSICMYILCMYLYIHKYSQYIETIVNLLMWL